MSGAEYPGRLRSEDASPQFRRAEDVPAQRCTGEVAAKVETSLVSILMPNSAGKAESHVREYKSRPQLINELVVWGGHGRVVGLTEKEARVIDAQPKNTRNPSISADFGIAVAISATPFTTKPL
jgi:hypothetical protein